MYLARFTLSFREGEAERQEGPGDPWNHSMVTVSWDLKTERFHEGLTGHWLAGG